MGVKRKTQESETPSTTTHTVPKSVLQAEDGAFPRGGGSKDLSSLDIRRVTNDANRDALFGTPDEPKKKKIKRRQSTATQEQKDKKPGIKIDSISFAKLKVGSVVLGQISQVNDLDIVLSLPNNLVGYVPITNVSKAMSERLESVANESESDSDEDEDEDSMPDMSMFQTGQWLRAVVTENSTGTANSKKRIELSIEPEKVNGGLLEEEEDLTRAGMAIQACIKSVEDHGCVMDIGSANILGFISKKELSKAQITAQPGLVLLLTTLSKSANGRTITLTASPNAKKVPHVDSLASPNSLTAGMLVEADITEVRKTGLVAKVLEFSTATIDLTHSGKLAALDKEFEVGQKVQARITCVFASLNNTESEIKIALSLQANVVALKSQFITQAFEAHPFGSKVGAIVRVVDSIGLFVEFEGKTGYVHISGVSDDRIDELTSEEKYEAGTKHKARVIGYSNADSMYILSLSKSVLEQKYLRAADIPAGEIIQVTVEKVIPGKGVGVKVTNSIDGFVDELHLTDIALAHPEKLYKVGQKIKARVLSTGKRVKLTFKKSILNSEDKIISSYADATVGMRTPGVIILLKRNGAIVEFFSGVKAFLPVAEMSEAFIQDPKEHFKIGQCVAVYVTKVDVEDQKMTVTCRAGSEDTSKIFEALNPGSIVSAEVIEKPKDGASVVVRLDSGLRGVILGGHLADEGNVKNKVGVKKTKVGDTFEELVVLEKDTVKRFITLSAKPALVADAKKGHLPCEWADIAEEKVLHGYIHNITANGLFVRFANRLTGLVPKNELADEEFISDLNEKFTVDQLVQCRVLMLNDATKRFVLSLKSGAAANGSKKQQQQSKGEAVNAVDGKITDLADYVPGLITKAKVVSVKDTQVNVLLADKQHGRIDASLAFDAFEDIVDPKSPLKGKFKKGEVVDVKIVGYHDARNHKFLPISHRNATYMLAELSCRSEDLKSESTVTTIQLNSIKVGNEWTGIINNVNDDFVYVNITPTVRGRIPVLDLVDVGQVTDDIEQFYPVGSAVKCSVVEVGDILKLSARKAQGTAVQSASDVKPGDKLPGVVTKINDHSILVRLGAGVFAQAGLTDLVDEYAEDGASTTAKFAPHELVKCQVISTDNDRIRVTVRPSVFDDQIEVADKVIESVEDIGKGEVIRGFVKNIAKSGLFVQLGRTVTGRVEIRNLSDAFLTEWQNYFKLHQRVTARVLSVEDGKVNLTLKESAVTGEKRMVGIADLVEGAVVPGTVKRIEDYGVFVRLEGGASGLCHKSQVADVPVNDLTKVFSVGDAVKVKVLSVDTEKGRVALGMKASYFGDDSDIEEDDDEEVDGEDSDVEMNFDAAQDDSDEESEDESDSESEQKPKSNGLSAGFDWNASILDQIQKPDESGESSSDEDEGRSKKKRKRSKAIVQDKTATMQTRQPQSMNDFERLLIGSPNSSLLWMQYMGFQLQLSEVDKARDIGARALKTISFREEQERENIWIAMLNLENSFGTPDTLDQVFRRSLQYMDPISMYLKLVHIYESTRKPFSLIEKLVDEAIKKHGAKDEKLATYDAYFRFLLKHKQEDKARAVLNRALQAVPKERHNALYKKYARLLFDNGLTEQGRTFFEHLIDAYPKKLELWTLYVDCEIKFGSDPALVRQLFEREFKTARLNVKQGKVTFKKWFEYEEKHGDDKSLDYVKAKAMQFVEEKSKKADNADEE